MSIVTDLTNALNNKNAEVKLCRTVLVKAMELLDQMVEAAKAGTVPAGEPKRYVPGYEVDESSRGIRLVMDQSDAGDFVRFSDHDRIVAALQGRVGRQVLVESPVA